VRLEYRPLSAMIRRSMSPHSLAASRSSAAAISSRWSASSTLSSSYSHATFVEALPDEEHDLGALCSMAC
jgi:hypothetical protein